MIVYDLRCERGHVFDAWFGKGSDFDDQASRGLVACPVCESPEVAKAVMAPAVPAKGNSRPAPAEVKALIGKLAAAQRRVLAGSDYVGDRFATEARAIHLGESDARAIHGQATRGDVESLVADGVPVAPLPLPVVPPSQEN